MAQVRKYKPGGVVKAEGGLKYDDNEWSGAEFINNFRQWGQNKYRNDYDKLMVFGKIIDAIESGEQFTYDSDKLMLSPSDAASKFELSDNKRISNKLKKAPTWWERNFPTNRDAYRTVIADLRNYNYNVPEEAPKAKEKVDWSDKVTYYITSNSEKHPVGTGKNNAAIQRLTDIINGRTEGKEYILYGNLDGTTYDKVKNGGDYYNTYNAILSKLNESKSLTQRDIADLETFGIVVKDIAENTPDPVKKPEVEQKPISKNLELLVKEGIITGNDVDGYNASPELIASYGNAAMFNDNWKKSKANYDARHAALYGYTLLNGKLYKTDTWNTPGTQLYKYIAQKGILDKIQKGKFEEANKELNYQWGHDDYKLQTYDTYTYFPGVDLNRNDEFIDWSQWDDTYRYITGNTGDTSDIIFKYWYPGLYKEENPWSIEFKYSSDIVPKGFVQAPIDYNTRIKAPGTQYDGKVAVASSNVNPAFTYYYDPTDSNSNMIFQFHRPELASKLNNKAIVIPSDIARELLAPGSNGVSFLNQKNWSYQKLKEFANILMSKVATGWSDVIHNIPEADDYTKGGAANGSLLEQLFNNWVKRNGQSAESRQNEFLIDPYQHPPMHKNGGIIRSFQPGGYMLPSLDIIVEDTPKQKDVADIIDIPSEFTAQDWWDVINLGADVGALITSLFPGGNPLSSGIGALSTISQTAANISRDGLDLDDAVNLITGLGFDAVSLVPGIGTGAKIGKLTKMVTNIAPILTTGFGLLQLPQSVTAVHNIVNGNSTMEDWRDLLYGIQALRGIRKSKKMIKETRVSNPKTVEALPEGANWGQRTAHKAKEKSAAVQNHWKGMLMKNREFVIPENATTADIIDMYKSSSERAGRAKAIYEISPAAKSQIDNAGVTFKRLRDDDDDLFPRWRAIESKKKGGIIKAQDGWKGFWKDVKDGANNLDLLNLTELGTTIAGNAMIADAQKKQVDAAWKADLKTYTPKSTPIYNQSVLDAGYVDRKNQINNTTFTHSDPRYNLSFQFQKLKSRNDLDREYWSNVARFNSEYNNNLIETNWQNRTLAQQIADNNRAAFYQGQAAKHEVDAQHWNNQFKTVANYFTQLRANRDKKLAYDRDLYTKMYTTQYQQQLNDAQTTLNNAWTAASKNDSKLIYTDWIKNAGSTAYADYQKSVKNISNDYYTNLGSLTNKRKLWKDPKLT